MTETLIFVKESRSGEARLYAHRDGTQQWIPRSVCERTLKLPAENGKPAIHQVEVADWWREKNPWPGDKQSSLNL